MKSFLMKALKFNMILIIVFGLLMTGVGYYQYEKTIQNYSIDKEINELRNSKDFVRLTEVNEIFLNSIVATEDHRFYSHGALDFISIIRATIKNIASGRVVQGGSTITQQLAKNLFLSNEKKMDRKIQEMYIAFEIERKYSKSEILELYVNRIYYGHGYTGIKNATQGYFHKEPKDLSYHEATLLAGVPQAPSRYDLTKHNEKALQRQKNVIRALETYGMEVEEKREVRLYILGGIFH